MPTPAKYVTVEIKIPRAVAEWFSRAAKAADMTPEQVYRVALIVFSALYGQLPPEDKSQ